MKNYIKDIKELFAPNMLHVGLLWASGGIYLLINLINHFLI